MVSLPFCLSEVFPFPVGGIAAVVVALLVAVLLLVKLLSVTWTAWMKKRHKEELTLASVEASRPLYHSRNNTSKFTEEKSSIL